MNKGFLLIFSGPSGSGKDSVLRYVLERDENITLSISMTTREPRVGETDGKDYFFVTKEEFERHIENDEMLEWAKYDENYYGTPKAPIEKWISLGKTVILEIETQGADKIRAKFPGVLSVFLMPPSLEVLEERLRGRKTNTEEDIRRRLDTAKMEIERASDYDFVVVNEIREVAADEMVDIIRKHRKHLQSVDEEVK